MSATIEIGSNGAPDDFAEDTEFSDGLQPLLSPRLGSPKFWRSVMPAAIKKKLRDDASAWTEYLTRRKSPEPVGAVCRADSSPLRWGVDPDALTDECHELVAAADHFHRATANVRRKAAGVSKQTPKQNALLAEWKNDAASSDATTSRGLSALAVSHLLACGAGDVDPQLWWHSIDALWQIVQMFDAWQLDPQCTPEDALAQQLLAGELPLTLAYLFPEIKPLHGLRDEARERLGEALDLLLNGEGLLHGRLIGSMFPLMACWTRCRAIGSSAKKGFWSRDAETQYAWAARQSLRWSTADRRLLLSSEPGVAWSPAFVDAVIRLGGDESDAVAASSLLGKTAPSVNGKAARFSEPEMSDHCEWSGLALLRAGWSRDAAAVAVNFSQPAIQFDAVSGRHALLRGDWDAETSLDGRPLQITGQWDEICWFSDDDVDYLELSIDLEDGAQLDRQIVLARDERFLLLADYVKTQKPGSLQHVWSLPLAGGCRFEGEDETREGLLVCKKPAARALPVALPEWRSDPRGGELTVEEGRLKLRQQFSGTAIACPLLIDLDPRRANKSCTWRQLTVAHALEVQPRDVAVGYRVQCAKRQWLIYRSLAGPANRTILGQNTTSDCLIARFLAPEGTIEELVEIEG